MAWVDGRAHALRDFKTLKETVMISIARLAGWTTGAAVAAMLLTPAVLAARPEPGESRVPGVIVREIEIPVPVDDHVAEAVQMSVAAALGAAAAVGLGVGRLRRRTCRTPDGNGADDIAVAPS
jgi:hypothetical protein